jgi:hypothetical protein
MPKSGECSRELRNQNEFLDLEPCCCDGAPELREVVVIGAADPANLAHPPRYDFLCFWLDGRVALTYHNVYAPAYFHLLGDSLAQPADWVREFLDVGFLYPPISVVWFAPLGLFRTPGAALAAWYRLLFAALALSVIALWRQFFRPSGIAGLLAASALLMAFPATAMDMASTQTIGIALLFALLFRGDRNPWRAGIWIALALSVKPFLITLLIVPLITRSWKTVGAAAAAVCALIAAALAIIGPSGFLTYFRDSPVGRVPGYMYSGMWNQSLLGWILRLSRRDPAALVVAHETLYLTLVAIVVATTVLICCVIVRSNRDAAIALSLLLGLLVYPQTLYFYSLLLVLPIAIMWTQARGGVTTAASSALAIGAIAALVGVRGWSLVHFAIGITYAVIAAVALWPCLRHQGGEARAARRALRAR